MICVPAKAIAELRDAMADMADRTDKSDLLGMGKILGTLLLLETLEERYTVIEVY